MRETIVQGAGLTVAEAAKVLGVSERTLRRALKEPDIEARTLAVDRQTEKGCRRTTVLPPDLVADLDGRFHPEPTAGDTPAETPAHSPADRPADSPAGSPANTGAAAVQPVYDMRLVAVYDALIREKDARIQDLAARVEFLETTVKREQDALARFQTLRAIEGGKPDQGTSDTVAGSPADTVAGSPANTGAPVNPTDEGRPRWRLWGWWRKRREGP